MTVSVRARLMIRTTVRMTVRMTVRATVMMRVRISATVKRGSSEDEHEVISEREGSSEGKSYDEDEGQGRDV